MVGVFSGTIGTIGTKMKCAPMDKQLTFSKEGQNICLFDASLDQATSIFFKKIVNQNKYKIQFFVTKETAIKAVLQQPYQLIIVSCVGDENQWSVAEDFITMVRFCGHPEKSKLPVIIITPANNLDSQALMEHESVSILRLPTNLKAVEDCLQNALATVANRHSIKNADTRYRKSKIPLIDRTTIPPAKSNEHLADVPSDNAGFQRSPKPKSKVDIPTILPNTDSLQHASLDKTSGSLPEDNRIDKRDAVEGESFLLSHSIDDADIHSQHFCADELALMPIDDDSIRDQSQYESSLVPNSNKKNDKKSPLRSSQKISQKFAQQARSNIRTKLSSQSDKAGEVLSKKSNYKNQLLLSGGVLAIVASIVIGAFGLLDDIAEQVSIVHVTQRPVVDMLSTMGEVVSTKNTDINSVNSGTVESILILEGTEVQKNQILVRLENADIVSELSQVESQLATTNKNIETATVALKKLVQALGLGAVSRNTVAGSQDELLLLEEKGNRLVKKIETLLLVKRRSIIKAPFNGMVLNIQVKEGQWITPQDMLLQLIDHTSKEIKVISEKTKNHGLKIGQEVRVYVIGDQTEMWSEKISRIADQLAENDEMTFFTHLSQIRQNLEIGTKVQADIQLYANSRSLVLPRNVIREIDNQSFVPINLNGSVHYIPIETGIIDGEYREILNGLSQDQEIIYFSNGWLEEGVKIRQKI